MNKNSCVDINTKPFILEETEDFAVVYKPPKMHCVPLKENEGNTLADWYAEFSIYSCLMHRLDFETHGLLLFAKNPNSYNFFKDLQDKGGIIKEYSAICDHTSVDASSVPGFPPPPNSPLIIESYFRPYGLGRKLVRPIIHDSKKHEIAKDKGGFYQTEITEINDNVFKVRIKRGFRHQIRCHLCWIGRPILNDPLYPQPTEIGTALALRAHALFFTDPSSGKQVEYKIDLLTAQQFSAMS